MRSRIRNFQNVHNIQRKMYKSNTLPSQMCVCVCYLWLGPLNAEFSSPSMILFSSACFPVFSCFCFYFVCLPLSYYFNVSSFSWSQSGYLLSAAVRVTSFSMHPASCQAPEACCQHNIIPAINNGISRAAGVADCCAKPLRYEHPAERRSCFRIYDCCSFWDGLSTTKNVSAFCSCSCYHQCPSSKCEDSGILQEGCQNGTCTKFRSPSVLPLGSAATYKTWSR